MYHYYCNFIITVAHCCICVGNVREGQLLWSVDASHYYEGLKQGPLEQDIALLQLLIGTGHGTLLGNCGLGLVVHGSGC